MGEFELPLRVGLIFDTTLVATRMIYGGVFERYPNFPYIMAHTGGATITPVRAARQRLPALPRLRRVIAQAAERVRARSSTTTAARSAAPALMHGDRLVGTSQLLFGTDDPFIGSDSEHVDRLPISPADKAAILGGDAKAMLGVAGPLRPSGRRSAWHGRS